ncbi:DDE-type integrase/transposase/recombinase [Xenorhabdus japonica]|uniref:DDE-type integrase/transposase/recombinase n=1 Tax=Xenorhabdus japonica TaxID=53341 RepID=UPI000B8A3B93|nr:DDE-type integrase/transposase/recombinase [Xenorhabdus japonica]
MYKAVDSEDNTIDFYLSPQRNIRTACRFLEKALKGFCENKVPIILNTDKASNYGRALNLLKHEGNDKTIIDACKKWNLNKQDIYKIFKISSVYEGNSILCFLSNLM